MHVSEKRFGCKIILHKEEYPCADYETLKFYTGYQFQNYLRWQWYFRYLAAKYQVQYPRQCVELREFNYAYTPPAEQKKKQIQNKLRSAKAKVTEWNNKLRAHIDNHRGLFPAEDHPLFKKAVEKIKQKENEVRELERVLDNIQKEVKHMV